MKTVCAIFAFASALVVADVAHAEKPRAEVSVMAGYGLSALDTSNNSFGFGAGACVGASFGSLWLGATATYHLGEPQAANAYTTSGTFIGAQQYSLSTFSAGGEVGFNVHLFVSATGALVLRPYAWLGTNVYVPSPLNTFTPPEGTPNPIVRFAVAPSLHVDYELKSGLFFGADVRVNMLVPGKAPLTHNGWAYSGWYDAEHFTAEIAIYAVVGKRF